VFKDQTDFEDGGKEHRQEKRKERKDKGKAESVFKVIEKGTNN